MMERLRFIVIVLGSFLFALMLACESQQDSNVEEVFESAIEEASQEIEESLESTDSTETEPEELDSVEFEGSSEIEDFYQNIVSKLDPDLDDLSFVQKGFIDIPSSLAEEFEGGGILPTIVEVYNNSSLIGVILFDIDSGYPLTFSFALIDDEDGFYPPISDYKLIDVASHPVLRIVRSKSGLLDEGPFIQSYYSVRGVGHLPSPLISAEGHVFSEEEEGQVMNKIVDKYYPFSSFSKNCPPDIEDDGPKNIQLDFSRYGIITATEFTGFTTDIFYYYPTDSTLLNVPIKKYMTSPEGEVIEGQIDQNHDTLSLEYIQNDRIEIVKISGDSEYMKTGTYCR